MKILWLIVGIIYLAIGIQYFRLAYKTAQFISPETNDYLDETARINKSGFVMAGMLSFVAGLVAFLSAFLLL